MHLTCLDLQTNLNSVVTKVEKIEQTSFSHPTYMQHPFDNRIYILLHPINVTLFT